jgi:hypothetical protein
MLFWVLLVACHNVLMFPDWPSNDYAKYLPIFYLPHRNGTSEQQIPACFEVVRIGYQYSAPVGAVTSMRHVNSHTIILVATSSICPLSNTS